MNYFVTFFLTKMTENRARNNGPEKDDESLSSVMMRVGWDIGHQVEIDTGLLISAEGWNTETQRCRRGTLHGPGMCMAARIVNRQLQELERAVGMILETLKVRETDQEVCHRISTLIDPENQQEETTLTHVRRSDSLPLLECMEWYIEEQRLLKGWSVSTQSKLTGYLRAFMPLAQLRDIDRGWMSRFLRAIGNSLSLSFCS